MSGVPKMNLSQARIRIFFIWGAALLLYIIMFEFCPFFRTGIISPRQAHAGLLKILSLVSPVLGTFSAYWFTSPGTKVTTGKISRERWLAAFWATIAYHAILIIYLAVIIYWHDYRGTEDGIGKGESSFDALVGNAMQLGILLSAVATAPAAFLVGAEHIETGRLTPS